LTSGVYLLHDNARPHTGNFMKRLLDSFGCNVLNHHPYSHDLEPSDYHLFTSPKKIFNRRGGGASVLWGRLQKINLPSHNQHSTQILIYWCNLVIFFLINFFKSYKNWLYLLSVHASYILLYYIIEIKKNKAKREVAMLYCYYSHEFNILTLL